MAKLFLSYSRKDEARARRFAEWLEREGHDVWRDAENIGGGASFSLEIERALQNCDAVLVLWSAASVQSAWVRDEAAYGRDAGKLIPFSLEGTEPPLGFRQYQSINLPARKAHLDPKDADRIRQAISRIAGGTRSNAEASPPSKYRPREMPRRLFIGLATMLALAGFAAFLWQRWSNHEGITIAVLPSPQSPDRATATDYANLAAADMAAFLPRRFDGATVIAPDDAGGSRAAYRLAISTDPHGVGANATLTLSDEGDHTTLWSRNWSVADASAADLKAQVSASASKAALCLTDARGSSRRLSQPALGLYLAGCTDMGDTKISNADFVAMFDRITKLNPDFGPAWDYLALSRAWIAEGLEDKSPAAHAEAARSARDAIAIARRLNPHSAMSYDAEYHLTNRDRFRALEILEKGAQVDPDDGRIQMHLSNELLSVGRLSDSVEAAQRGVELEPSTPYTRSQYILALVYSGQFAKAKADITEARKKWPNDPEIDFADFSFEYRYGDPKVGLGLLHRVGNYSDADLVPAHKVIEARLDPTPAKIDSALEALNARWSNEQRDRNIILLALGNFGRVEEAYQLLDDPKFQPFIDTDALFRPDFAKVRADPRFMRVAARVGLVRYWKATGYWPDFCKQEQLRYDCKAEAARYPS